VGLVVVFEPLKTFKNNISEQKKYCTAWFFPRTDTVFSSLYLLRSSVPALFLLQEAHFQMLFAAAQDAGYLAEADWGTKNWRKPCLEVVRYLKAGFALCDLVLGF